MRTICKQYKNNIRTAVSDPSRVGFGWGWEFFCGGAQYLSGKAVMESGYEEEKNHRTDSVAAGGKRGLHGLRQQCEHAQALAQPLRLPVFLVMSQEL